MAIKTAEMETGIPSPAQARLLRFTEQLTAFSRMMLGCEPLRTTPQETKAALAATLHANEPEKPFQPRSPGYVDTSYAGIFGSDLKIDVSDISQSPRVRLVDFSFGSACGVNDALVFFEPTNDGWRDVLDWHASHYKEASDAFGDFVLTAILNLSENGGWRAVVAHGTPWCTSRFSNFKLDVLAPTADPGQPRVVWHANRDYSRGDYQTRLRASGNTFEFRTNVAAFTPEEFERTAVLRYRVTGDMVERIEPLATNGRGFVDEWLRSPWKEANAQTAQDNRAVLHDAYVSCNEKSERKHESKFTEVRNGPIVACPAKTYQVRIDCKHVTFDPDKVGDAEQKVPPMFFRIRETADGYQMMNVTSTPAPECTGPNLIPMPKEIDLRR